MSDDPTDPLLLTPGPLTTAPEVRAAMARDWGSRDRPFIALTARVRTALLSVAGGTDSHECVLLQGSGSYALEAAIGTLVPRAGKLLVLVNGAYGRRMARMAEVVGRAHAVSETVEDAPPDPAGLDGLLAADPGISHVAVCQCETTSGILNPVAEIAAVVAARGRCLLVDAMSGFGALPLDLARLPCEAVIASANKCLEGVPGVAFVLVERGALAAAAANAPSLVLDLHDQWRAFEATGQWRFTPPTHVMAAFDRALAAHAAEGGVAARGGRYRANCEALVRGMRALGFETYLTDARQAPIIVTFHSPADPGFDFAVFYDALERRGYVIYPGKLTAVDTFRIGCIGDFGTDAIAGVLDAVDRVLAEMGVQKRGRAAA